MAESARGGAAKAYGALSLVEPLATDARLALLDFESPSGIMGIVGAALRALSRLPFDVRIAHAVSALVTTQRATIETHDFERRLAALERATPQAETR